jgi:hypothetical protein
VPVMAAPASEARKVVSAAMPAMRGERLVIRRLSRWPTTPCSAAVVGRAVQGQDQAGRGQGGDELAGDALDDRPGVVPPPTAPAGSLTETRQARLRTPTPQPTSIHVDGLRLARPSAREARSARRWILTAAGSSGGGRSSARFCPPRR